MAETTVPGKKNVALTYGLIGGLILAVYLFCLYLGGVEAMLSPISWLAHLILIAVAVMGGLAQRKLNGGHLPFAEALKTVFTICVLAFLIQTAFSYVLMNFIDTSFRDQLTVETMNKVEQFMRKLGAPEEQIEKAIEEASQKNPYSVSQVLLGFGIWCIVLFIISLIIAAIIKRNKSPFENSFNQ